MPAARSWQMLRLLCATCLVLCAGCAARAMPAVRTEPSVPPAAFEVSNVTFAPLADNLWLHTTTRHVEGWGDVISHGLIFVDAGRALLIDTGWTADDTRVIRRVAARRLGAPITHAVITHAHADKAGGSSELSGVQSFWHEQSPELATEHNIEAPELITELVLAPGAEFVLPEFPGVHIVFPGAAHTRDNLVVYFEEARVLFGGCMIRPGESDDLGNTADADVTSWARSTQVVAQAFPEASIVVPSHGAPGGRELLEHTIALARVQ